VLGQLHEAVFAPIAVRLAALGAGDDLVIAPHGPLHAVPFHALWDGKSYLVERLTISVTPSLAVYDQCAAATRPAGRPLVVGIGDQLAPRALDEAHAIAAMIGADLLAGEEATAAAVAGAAPGRSLLHVASHAWHRADNPMFSAIRLADRWVTAAEVLDGFDLAGTTVVLSACDTGRSSLAGSELLGLVRGFLGAGAASLVVSLWPTHDAATAELMHRFHEALPRLGTAAALRAAQLHGLSTFGHPSFWAPFTLVGAR
jgi:CHAT domain-containing protein